jgi:hypothetical protein
VSLTDIEFFFNEYVKWMRRDIEREIEWAADGRDAGNLLCALGLVSYTEALGRVRRANLDPAFKPGDTEANFNETFDRLDDGEYGRWRANEWRARYPMTSVYELLRCGLVHEYLPKIDAKIHMGPEQRRGLELEGDTLVFYVVAYFRHFCIEADRLLADLRKEQQARVPSPYLKRVLQVLRASPTVSGSSVASGTSGAVASTNPDGLRKWPEDWRKPKP